MKNRLNKHLLTANTFKPNIDKLELAIIYF